MKLEDLLHDPKVLELKNHSRTNGNELNIYVCSDFEKLNKVKSSEFINGRYTIWIHDENRIMSCEKTKPTKRISREFLIIKENKSDMLKRYIKRVAPKKNISDEYILKSDYFNINEDYVTEKEVDDDNKHISSNNKDLYDLSLKIKSLITSNNVVPNPTKGKIFFDFIFLEENLRMLKLHGFDLSTYEEEDVIVFFKVFRYTEEIKDHMKEEYGSIKNDILLMWNVIYELLDLSYNQEKLKKFPERKSVYER